MKLLLALAAGAIGYCYYRGRNLALQPGARPVELQRWEGEGGNVPSVATPRPAFSPDPAVRH